MTRHTVKAKNFYSSIGSEMAQRVTPYVVYQALALDAVLLEFDEQLPDMHDEQYQFVVDVATTAAWATLQLASVPDDWLDLVANLPANRDKQIRADITNVIRKLTRDPTKVLGERQRAALERIRALFPTENQNELHAAVLALDEAYLDDATRAAEQGFRLGYEIARDPERLVYDKVGE